MCALSDFSTISRVHGSRCTDNTWHADLHSLLVQVTREVFDASKGRLKVVGRAGVGIDNVDLQAATEVSFDCNHTFICADAAFLLTTPGCCALPTCIALGNEMQAYLTSLLVLQHMLAVAAGTYMSLLTAGHAAFPALFSHTAFLMISVAFYLLDTIGKLSNADSAVWMLGCECPHGQHSCCS